MNGKWAKILFSLFVQTDPFNRSLLTADMLVPDVELKSRIDEYLASHTKK